MEIDDSLKDRGANTATFSDHARIAQSLKQTMGETLGWQRLSPEKKRWR